MVQRCKNPCRVQLLPSKRWVCRFHGTSPCSLLYLQLCIVCVAASSPDQYNCSKVANYTNCRLRWTLLQERRRKTLTAGILMHLMRSFTELWTTASNLPNMSVADKATTVRSTTCYRLQHSGHLALNHKFRTPRQPLVFGSCPRK